MPRYIDVNQIVFWVRHVSSNGLDSDVRKVAFSDEIERIPTVNVVESVSKESRKNTIDEFTNKLKWEFENSIGTTKREVNFAKAVIEEVAKRMKGEQT